jgi:hypothetical protein
MNLRKLAIVLAGVCVIAWILPDVLEARGGRGFGGGGFSRGGGGGFSRGGGGYGSIRNSARPSTRESLPSSRDRDFRPSGDSFDRPSQGAIEKPVMDRLPDQMDNRIGEGALSDRQEPGIEDRASTLTPEQRLEVKDRAANLTPDEKEQIRQKFENSGLKPSQLPTEDHRGDREDWREDWQEWRNENREDWQDWYEDEYDDYWDDYWHYSWWYGYPVSSVSYSFYINDDVPCRQTVVVSQATRDVTYYYCNSVWYVPVYGGSDVQYVITSPPAGVEVAELSHSFLVTVDGQDYYLNNHAFYQKIVRDGQTLYVLVDAPVGAKVPTIPPYAIEIQHEGKTYYRFDKIFYQRQGDAFVVVANPGV